MGAVRPDASSRRLATLEAVHRHVRRHLGAVDLVFSEGAATGPGIDLLHVPPGKSRPFHTLVTSGLSARPTGAPHGRGTRISAELFLLLDRDWPCSRRAWRDPRWGWPARELRRFARTPTGRARPLRCGRTFENGEPPRPYAAGTAFCAAILARPVSSSEGFEKLLRPEGLVRFFQWIPLYGEEARFAERYSSNALFARFAQHDLADVIHIDRKNVCSLQRSSRCTQISYRGWGVTPP